MTEVTLLHDDVDGCDDTDDDYCDDYDDEADEDDDDDCDEEFLLYYRFARETEIQEFGHCNFSWKTFLMMMRRRRRR